MEILKSTYLLIKYIACRQYWPSEQISLELKVVVSSLLNIRSTSPEVSCKKVLLKFLLKSLLLSLIWNFRLANFIEKIYLHTCFPENFAEVLKTPIL